MAREIRLHDTRTGRKLPLEPRDPGRVGIYSCGPTVYNRIHVGNARGLRRPLAVQALPRARGLRDDARRQRHRHQRQDLRRRAAAGDPERRPGAGDDGALLRRHRGPGPGAARSRAAGLGDDRAHQGPHPGPARQRVGLRGRRRRLLPGARGPRLRLAEPPLDRRHGPGGGGRRLRSQGGSARLRAVEGPEGGRGHRVGRALGPRPAGLAHRVLGDGRAGCSVPARRARAARRAMRAPGSSPSPPRERRNRRSSVFHQTPR